MEIDGAQVRAARALLGWDQERLRQAADVAKATVVDFERKARRPMAKNIEAIRRAFEAAGITFIDENGGGRGVRFTAHMDETADAEADQGEADQ